MLSLSNRFWDKKQSFNRKNILQIENDILGQQYKDLFSRINLQPKNSFFEFGCGDSIVLEYLTETYDVIPHGVDFSDVGIDLVRKRLPGFSDNFIFSDYREFETRNVSFDATGSFGFIEHIDEREGMWKLKYAITKPGGYCIVTFPNLKKLNLWFAEQFTCAMDWHISMGKDEIAEEALQAQFELVDSGYFGGYRIFTTPEKKIIKPIKLLANIGLALWWSIRRHNNEFGSPFVYLILKKPV